MPTTKGEPGGLTQAVAATLRARLARLEWTQQHLASMTGVSQSHLSQILKGRRHIYLDQFGGICEAMDLDPVQVIDDAWRDALEGDVDQGRLDEHYRRTLKPEPGEDRQRHYG